MRDFVKDAEHLIRMAGLFVLGLFLFLALRAVLIPHDFGRWGHFRAGAIGDNAARAPVFAGRAACASCHENVVQSRRGGRHENLGCEICHGPRAAHAADPSVETPPRPAALELCLSCHRQSASRPGWLPQIDPTEHMDGGACDACHDSHRPGFEQE